MVREERLELSKILILNQARLPIPPFPHLFRIRKQNENEEISFLFLFLNRPKSGIRTHDLLFPKQVNQPPLSLRIFIMLPQKDSNLWYKNQNLVCCHYTTGQFSAEKEIRTLKILILNQTRIPFRHFRMF